MSETDRRPATGRADATGTVLAVPTYLALDVGTDRLAAGIVDDVGEVLVRDRVATPPRDVWPALHRLVRRVMAARPAEAEAIVGCGVTTEGPIDRLAGTASPLHLAAWTSFPLEERMAELTGLPIAIGTAAHGRVVAERWIGAAQGVDDVMVVLLSTAVEAGVITGGRLARGRMGNAGAIGHVLVEPEGLDLCLRRPGLSDAIRVGVGVGGRDQSAVAAGAGLHRRAGRRDAGPSGRIGDRGVRSAARPAHRVRAVRVRRSAARRDPS